MLNPTGAGRHHSGSAKPPPPGDKPVGPAPPPPPWWRRWLLPVGFAITLWLLFFPSMSDPAVSFTYTEFLAEVDADNVATITIETEGDVEGELKDGTEFKSAIPVALSGEELLTRLESHGVTVEARSTRTTLLDVIVSFAPFLLLLGLFIYLGRRARGQLAGLTGMGRARASVLDTDRPSTRFSDIAGYELDGVVIDDTKLFNDKLQEWENFYNFNRPHGGLDGQTPYERLRQKTTESPPV